MTAKPNLWSCVCKNIRSLNTGFELTYKTINVTNIPGSGLYGITPNGRKRFILNGKLGIALTAGEERTIYTNETLGASYTALSKILPITRSQNPIFAALRISVKGEVSLTPYADVPTTQNIFIDEVYF